MRPMYENANDLRSEKNLISYVSDCWNVASYKLPMSYKIDYAMYRIDTGTSASASESLVGFAEVKCRTHTFGTFPTYIISLAKVMEARRLARETNTKSILIVSWTDQEPMCHFDLKHFKGIGVRDEQEC